MQEFFTLKDEFEVFFHQQTGIGYYEDSAEEENGFFRVVNLKIVKSTCEITPGCYTSFSVPPSVYAGLWARGIITRD